MSYITFAAAYVEFAEIADAIKKQYGNDDVIALREGWNDFTDGLCKEGRFSDIQYNHCPAYDDVNMNDDESDDMAYILDSMGFGFHHGPVQSRRDDDMLSDMPRHFKCTISRHSKSYDFWYSQGSAHTSAPDFFDVFSSLLQDANGYEDDFSDWCATYGYDDDSRKAEAIWKSCKECRDSLLAMMTAAEMNEVGEHFGDLGL